MDEDIRNYSPSDESFEDFPLQISPMCSDDGSPPPPKRLMLMVHSACQVVTPSFDPLTPYLSGKRQRHIKVFEDPVGGGVGIAVNHDGLIVYIGRTDRMRVVYKDFMVERHIDATGMSVLPGFVDAHTHPVWAGDRIDEFGMKLRGLSYMEIHESGGGIFSTVDATSKADTDYLYDTLCERLKKMAESGTTLAECKSGYGLELDKEVRLLEILNKAKSSQRNVINMSITYCGAHAIPRNSNMKETTERIIDVDLPHIANLKKTGKMRVENVDVFCDEGVFSEENAELILWKAKSLGFQLNFHGDEHHPMNSGQMAARVGATAISHLEKITEDDIRCMKEKNIFAVLLPSPAYSMGVEPPPARALIRADVPVALGSDFNPNVYCYSMPLVMNLACVYLKMTMEEALVAATLNAAASLGKSDRHGSIVYNKFADLVIIKSPRWENIIYDFGNHGQIIKFVVKGGNIVKAPKSYDGTLPLLRTDDVLQSPKRSQSAQIRERKEKRMERKRRHSTSNSGTPTKAKVPHTSILGWYREQIVTIKKKFREDMQATTWRYGRYINQNAGLFQCLLQDASDEKESQECDSMLYRLLASDTSAGQGNVNQPQAGPSNVNQPQAGPSNVKQPQAGPSNVKQPQAGPSNVNQPQAGPSNVKQPQAGPSNLKQPQAGSSSVKYPQAGPSNVNQPQAGLFYVNQPQSVPFNVNQPQAGPSNVKQPQAGPSNVKQPQAGSSSVKHPQAGPSNVNLPQAGLFYVNQFQSVPFNVNQPQAGPSNVNQPQAGLVYVNQPQTGPSNINHPQAGPSNVNQLQAGLFYVNQPQSVPFNVNQPQGPFNVNQLQAGLVYVNQPQLAPFNVNQPRGPFNVNQPQAGPSNVDQLQAVPTNVNQTQAGPTNTPPNLALPQGSTSHNLPPYGERPSAVYFYLPPSQALANPYPGHALLTTGHHLYHPTEQNIAPSRTDQDVSESEQNANPSSETRNETE